MCVRVAKRDRLLVVERAGLVRQQSTTRPTESCNTTRIELVIRYTSPTHQKSIAPQGQQPCFASFSACSFYNLSVLFVCGSTVWNMEAWQKLQRRFELHYTLFQVINLFAVSRRAT